MAKNRNNTSIKKKGTSSPKSVGKTYRSSVSGRVTTSVRPAGCKYGEIRPEVREIVKRRLDKHASTWTELAKR